LGAHEHAGPVPEFAVGLKRRRIEGLIDRYGNQWIAVARRACSTASDAEDAYQRGLEILLRNPPDEVDIERVAAWMNTVVRNEALQIARSRKREVGVELESIAANLTSDLPPPDERVEDKESHGVVKEALQRLRPDQTRCLLLRADGFEYPEICRLTGFSYAKVNRLLSDGRKAVRVRVDSITAGRECERIEQLLSMFVDGVAEEVVANDVRIHLEHCLRCRQTARAYSLAPRGVAALLPVGVVPAAGAHRAVGDVVERVHGAIVSAYDRLWGHFAGNPAVEALSGKKIATASAITALLAGGGAAITHQAGTSGERARSGHQSPVVAVPSRPLFDAVQFRERSGHAHRASKHRRGPREADENDLLAVGDTSRASAQPSMTAADQQFAEDENNAVPHSAKSDTGTDVEGLAP
jgi:RNA polymerase sigma factor (sigma-70 family)